AERTGFAGRVDLVTRDHAPSMQGSRTATPQSAMARAARPGVARDSFVCQLKLPKCTGHATECDYIVDWRDFRSTPVRPNDPPSRLYILQRRQNAANASPRDARARREMATDPRSRQW